MNLSEESMNSQKREREREREESTSHDCVSMCDGGHENDDMRNAYLCNTMY